MILYKKYIKNIKKGNVFWYVVSSHRSASRGYLRLATMGFKLKHNTYLENNYIYIYIYIYLILFLSAYKLVTYRRFHRAHSPGPKLNFLSVFVYRSV